MQYELINPSDAYTFEANSREVAALTVFNISTAYAAHAETGKDDDGVPMFIFGGAVDWYKETFGRSPDEGITALITDVANALESFMLGHFEDRRRYKAALNAITDSKNRAMFMAEWQDGRSSLNDIGTYAHRLATQIKNSITQGGKE